MKKGISLFVIFFFFYSNCFAGFCGNSILVSLVKDSDGGSSCPEIAPDYPYTLSSDCSVSTKSVVGCLYVYKICCGDISKKYEDSTVKVELGQSVEIGREPVKAEEIYTKFKNSTSIGAPACSQGFTTTSEMMGYVYHVTPSYSTSDYTKSDVAVSMWNRVGCSKFTSSTTVVLNPVESGGGSNSASLAELQKTNTTLTSIKEIMDSIKTTGQASNPLLTDIKTLLQDGLDFNSAALETGINQVGINTASSNDILNAINNKLTQNCTTTWDPNINCYWGPPVPPSRDPVWTCSGGNVTNCKGIDVSDSAALGKLQEIKNLLASGSGGTVNVDMAQTNGILTDIKNFLIGASSLTSYNDDSGSKTAYSHSDFLTSTPTATSYKDEFATFQTNMESTPLYGLLGSFFGNVPHEGTSIIAFNGGRYGQHTVDFASWSSVFRVLKALVLIIFASLSLKIIFLKGGSG